MNQTTVCVMQMVISVRKTSDLSYNTTRLSKIPYIGNTELFDVCALS